MRVVQCVGDDRPLDSEDSNPTPVNEEICRLCEPIPHQTDGALAERRFKYLSRSPSSDVISECDLEHVTYDAASGLQNVSQLAGPLPKAVVS